MSVHVVDTSLRDGMHSVRHRFTPDQVATVAAALDGAGVPVIEVTHGDGLGGSSLQYGVAAASDTDWIAAAAARVENAELAVLLLPGVGTIEDLRAAQDAGARCARVATHCTEPDIGAQHLRWAAEHGMRAIGFLMMSHMLSPQELAEQALVMQDAGASVVYVVDSAGALLPTGAAARVSSLAAALDCEIGFHGHDNLGCAVGNALAARAAGATWLDGSVRGLGAGAGNAPTELLCATLERDGEPTGIDLFALMDVAEEIVAPLMPGPALRDRAAITLGYAGVYSSFLLHAERAAARFGIDARDVLVELGRRGTVGGQEDQVIGVAGELAARRRAGSLA